MAPANLSISSGMRYTGHDICSERVGVAIRAGSRAHATKDKRPTVANHCQQISAHKKVNINVNELKGLQTKKVVVSFYCGH